MKSRKKDIALFTDSIPKGINTRNFRLSLRGAKTYIKAFPGVKSTQLNHIIMYVQCWMIFNMMLSELISESMTFYNERMKIA